MTSQYEIIVVGTVIDALGGSTTRTLILNVTPAAASSRILSSYEEYVSALPSHGYYVYPRLGKLLRK
jgi:hypothetical protein